MRTEWSERLTLMVASAAAAAFVLLALVVGCLAEESELPVVVECVDEIALINTPHGCRLVFLRDRHVLATRCCQDDMLWIAGKGEFRVIWNDGGQARRVVTAGRFSIHFCNDDPLAETGLPWWAMQRNMRDLQQP